MIDIPRQFLTMLNDILGKGGNILIMHGNGHFDVTSIWPHPHNPMSICTCCVSAIVPAGSTVRMTQIVSPKNPVDGDHIRHRLSYMPAAAGDLQIRSKK